MKNIKTNYILPAVIAAMILSACGSPGLGSPGKPTALEPDPENPNRIEIYWTAVDGADIYYVYRSTAETGNYLLEGFSVTSAEAELSTGGTELRYSFVDAFDEGDGGTYWYGVTAASNSNIDAESAMSPVVSASTYSGTWGAAKELGDAAQLKLVADTSSLWAVYSTGGGTDPIMVQRYAEDENSTADAPPDVWTSVASPGNTTGNENNPFALFLNGGELYNVFADTGATVAGSVSMKYYHDSGTADSPSFAWEAVGAAGFNGAAATEISATTIGFGGTIYSAFLEGTAAQFYENNEEIVLSLSTVNDVKIITNNNIIYYGYESAAKYYIREYDSTFKTLEPETGTEVVLSAVDDGNIDFVSGVGDLYAVYIVDGGGLEINKLIDGSWGELADISGDTPPSAVDINSFGTLDAHWFNGYLYLFYIDSTDGRGWIKYYDEDEGWQNAQRIGGTAVTGTGSITGVQLASAGNTLYAGYIEGGKAYVRILE